MRTDQMITLFDVVSFIVGIASIVLAIVSLVLSIIFYKWSKDASEESSRLSKNIEAHTNYLKDLFDQMLKTTFDMIRDHNRAMDRRFLDIPGETEMNSQSKVDIDIFSEFVNKDQLKISDLATKYSVEEKTVENVVKEISKRGVMTLEIDGENIVKRNVANVKVGEVGES